MTSVVLSKAALAVLEERAASQDHRHRQSLVKECVGTQGIGAQRVLSDDALAKLLNCPKATVNQYLKRLRENPFSDAILTPLLLVNRPPLPPAMRETARWALPRLSWLPSSMGRALPDREIGVDGLYRQYLADTASATSAASTGAQSGGAKLTLREFQSSLKVATRHGTLFPYYPASLAQGHSANADPSLEISPSLAHSSCPVCRVLIPLSLSPALYLEDRERYAQTASLHLSVCEAQRQWIVSKGVRPIGSAHEAKKDRERGSRVLVERYAESEASKGSRSLSLPAPIEGESERTLPAPTEGASAESGKVESGVGTEGAKDKTDAKGEGEREREGDTKKAEEAAPTPTAPSEDRELVIYATPLAPVRCAPVGCGGGVYGLGGGANAMRTPHPPVVRGILTTRHIVLQKGAEGDGSAPPSERLDLGSRVMLYTQAGHREEGEKEGERERDAWMTGLEHCLGDIIDTLKTQSGEATDPLLESGVMSGQMSGIHTPLVDMSVPPSPCLSPASLQEALGMSLAMPFDANSNSMWGDVPAAPPPMAPGNPLLDRVRLILPAMDSLRHRAVLLYCRYLSLRLDVPVSVTYVHDSHMGVMPHVLACRCTQLCVSRGVRVPSEAVTHALAADPMRASEDVALLPPRAWSKRLGNLYRSIGHSLGSAVCRVYLHFEWSIGGTELEVCAVSPDATTVPSPPSAPSAAKGAVTKLQYMPTAADETLSVHVPRCPPPPTQPSLGMGAGDIVMGRGGIMRPASLFGSSLSAPDGTAIATDASLLGVCRSVPNDVFGGICNALSLSQRGGEVGPLRDTRDRYLRGVREGEASALKNLPFT
ncbi:hypothetical protein KIPB_001500 [Kipferlia bialata]|uniref:Uncharacterized protein n=1 Tax=Kipferlia bialata TaxID=797122 RepID=A0A9K3GF84_9EUKA|nr:hypothetical protein KIPB_001500 [Kipferlia bialata]|eukprot:g1500.t1